MSIENPLAYHVTMRLADDRVLAPSDLERRRAARVLLRIGRDFDLLAFRLADTHLHALVRCSAEASGRFCQRVACALLRRLALPAPFERGRRRPIADQRHLYRAFFYVLSQDTRHGLVLDPFHDASSLPDLLGLRFFDATIAARVRAFLPRVRPEELRTLMTRADGRGPTADASTQAPPAPPSSPQRPSLYGLDPNAATDAVFAAACATAADARDARVLRAQRSAARLSVEHVALRDLPKLLGWSARATRHLRRASIDAPAEHAILGQLALRASTSTSIARPDAGALRAPPPLAPLRTPAEPARVASPA